MANFGEMFDRRAISDHRCEYCFGRIPKHEIHKQFKGRWDDEWQNWRMHIECYATYSANSNYPDEGFMPGEGEVPERIKVVTAAVD